MFVRFHKVRRSKGFTLVELLLVVAILAVLAFLAVPAIANTIRNSRMRTCGSNEKMVEDAVWRWYADGIAAGLTVNPEAGDEDGEVTDEAIATLHVLFTHDDVEWPELKPYFTPGGPPTCPFTGNQDYKISLLFSDQGLDDVLVICDDSEHGGADAEHPRVLDRREEFEEEGSGEGS